MSRYSAQPDDGGRLTCPRATRSATSAAVNPPGRSDPSSGNASLLGRFHLAPRSGGRCVARGASPWDGDERIIEPRRGDRTLVPSPSAAPPGLEPLSGLSRGLRPWLHIYRRSAAQSHRTPTP